MQLTEATAILGIDAGSTTTKVALVGEDGSLLYSFYSSNNGSPLNTAIKAIKEIYSKMPAGCTDRIIPAPPDMAKHC